jgi:hypothetical protein
MTDAVETWHEFCDLLKDAGSVLLRDDLRPTEFDRGEGLRYLARLTSVGMLSFLENPGPRRPELRSLPEHAGFGLDNPDNVYMSATIDSRFDYRIRGSRGTIAYLSFAAQNQNYARRERISGGAGHLNDDELEIASDGTFEVIASQEPRPGNWLQLAPDSSMILVRQTFMDATTEVAADLTIECLAEPLPPPRLDPGAVRNQLLGAAMYAIGASVWFADWVAPWVDEPNTLHAPDPEHHRLVGGDPNIVFRLGYWELAPEQALVIETTPPRCDYWNFQLANIWTECLDRRYERISVNKHSAALEPDGSVRIVVAHEDPGHPNWVSTAGHSHGIMGVRWVRADSHPMPTCRVVPISGAGVSVGP